MMMMQKKGTITSERERAADEDIVDGMFLQFRSSGKFYLLNINAL